MLHCSLAPESGEELCKLFFPYIYLLFSYDGTGRVPVRICTTWLQEKTSESVDHDPFLLEDAMTTDSLLNITMKVGWQILTAPEKAKIDKDRYWEIG